MRSAMAAVGVALGHQPQHLALAGVSLLQHVGAPPAAEQLRDDLRVDRRVPPAPTPAHGGQELCTSATRFL